jgi:YetF C-terminal domain
MRERHNRNYPVLENMWLQNAFWASERATWIVLAVILLVALSGLLAHGPLSKSTVTDGGLSLTYERFRRVTALARFNARILVSYGDEASLRRARISEEDVLEAARRAHGLERMDEMKFAIFEASGRISIIPKRNVVPGEDGSAPGGD